MVAFLDGKEYIGNIQEWEELLFYHYFVVS